MISDISKTKEERQMNMWLIWALFWAGFIVWPLFWAFLLPFWVFVPYWFMAIFSIIETIVLLFFLEETNLHKTMKKIKYNPFKQIGIYIKLPKIRLFIFSLFFLILSFSLYQSILPLYLNKIYGISGTISGYILAWIWLVFVINQLFLLKKFWLKNFSLNQLLYITNIWLFLIFLGLRFVNSLFLFLILFIFAASLQIIVNPVYQGEIIENTELHSRGEIIGVLSSLQAMSMFIWPIIAGYLIDKNISIFLFSTLFVWISILFIFKIIDEKWVHQTK